MIKRVAISISSFITGIVISILVEPHLRKFIQYLYQVSTQHAIHFVGKNFHFFNSYFYYLGFGAFAFIWWKGIMNLTFKSKLYQTLLSILIFFFSLTLICYVGSNIRLIECTACDHGKLGIGYNNINYDGVIVTSLTFSVIPLIIKIARNRKEFRFTKAKPVY